jgi:hypothetical protein
MIYCEMAVYSAMKTDIIRKDNQEIKDITPLASSEKKIKKVKDE